MKNKTLEKIKLAAIEILVKEHDSSLFQQDVGDSCGLRVHLPNGDVLRMEISEIKAADRF